MGVEYVRNDDTPRFSSRNGFTTERFRGESAETGGSGKDGTETVDESDRPPTGLVRSRRRYSARLLTEQEALLERFEMLEEEVERLKEEVGTLRRTRPARRTRR
jgi:hypothetical protein